MIRHVILLLLATWFTLQVSLTKPFTPDHDLSLQVVYEDIAVPHAVIEKGDHQKGLCVLPVMSSPVVVNANCV